MLPGRLRECSRGCSGDVHRAAHRGTRGMVRGCCPRCWPGCPRVLGVPSPLAHRGTWGMLPGCSGDAARDARVRSRDARGMLRDAHRLARGMSAGCPGLLAGRSGAARPAARPALRSAPRAAAGGAAGPEGGSGAGRGWRLQPGSPAGQAPLTRLLCKLSSPVPPASLTSSPPGGSRIGGSPGPSSLRAGTGMAVPLRLALPFGEPTATPRQPGTQEGHRWVRPAACARRMPEARHPPPCLGTLGCPSRLYCQVGCKRQELWVGRRWSLGGFE